MDEYNMAHENGWYIYIHDDLPSYDMVTFNSYVKLTKGNQQK